MTLSRHVILHMLASFGILSAAILALFTLIGV